MYSSAIFQFYRVGFNEHFDFPSGNIKKDVIKLGTRRLISRRSWNITRFSMATDVN